MYEFIDKTTLAEYEAFIASHPKGHFAQSSLWGKQKSAWTWRAVAVRGEDGKIKGSFGRCLFSGRPCCTPAGAPYAI